MTKLPDIIQSRLAEDERTVWVSIDQYSQPDQAVPDSLMNVLPKAILSFCFAGALFFSALALPLGDNEKTIVIIFSLVAVTFGIFELYKSRLFRRFDHFSLIMYAPSFVSCVVTDRRVFLFNNPNGRVVCIDRNDLDSPMPEMGQGSYSLLLTRRSDGKRYLFITNDFVSPMRALAPEYAAQGASS